MSMWKNKKIKCALAAAGAAAILLTAVGQPLQVYAGVKDESTYDSKVEGSEKTYYRTIATNYHAGSIVGMVSTTLAPDMEKAANINQDGRSKGYEPVLYINDFKWDSDERRAADKVAQEMNGTLVSMLDVQLFRWEVTSFASVHDAGAPVTFVAGIPEKSHKDGNEYWVLRDDDREFAMVRVHNGEVTVLKDEDTDWKTITFTTDKFSAYGLMFAPAGEIDRYLSGQNGTETKEQPAAGAAAAPAQPAGAATAPAPASGGAKAGDELDEVPKTGDILWELEYGCAR